MYEIIDYDEEGEIPMWEELKIDMENHLDEHKIDLPDIDMWMINNNPFEINGESETPDY